MMIFASNLIERLKSRETWERVVYFAKLKSPKEGLKPLTKDDILPIIINIVFGILIIAMFYMVIDHFAPTK